MRGCDVACVGVAGQQRGAVPMGQARVCVVHGGVDGVGVCLGWWNMGITHLNEGGIEATCLSLHNNRIC